MTSAAAASRQKLRRQRAAAGLVHVEFWTDEANITATLIAGRYLDPNCADDPKAISAAAREMMESLAVVDFVPNRHA